MDGLWRTKDLMSETSVTMSLIVAGRQPFAKTDVNREKGPPQ